ncbi:DUF6530 family protein [Vallitalea maricola]
MILNVKELSLGLVQWNDRGNVKILAKVYIQKRVLDRMIQQAIAQK